MIKRKMVQNIGVFLGIVFLLTSCVNTFDQGYYEKLTELKAFHVKFIDDFTDKEGRVFTEAELAKYEQQGDLKFRETLEYASPIGDELRLNSLQIVWDDFIRHVGELRADQALTPPVMAEERKGVVGDNYDEAIRGELSRNGAPNL